MSQPFNSFRGHLETPREKQEKLLARTIEALASPIFLSDKEKRRLENRARAYIRRIKAMIDRDNTESEAPKNEAIALIRQRDEHPNRKAKCRALTSGSSNRGFRKPKPPSPSGKRRGGSDFSQGVLESIDELREANAKTNE